MSPKARITLTERAKEQAGIPAEATHFAFMYPLDCFAGQMQRLIEQQSVHKTSWLDALLLGAFAYFSEADDLLVINSLALVPSPNCLYLDGPYPCTLYLGCT